MWLGALAVQQSDVLLYTAQGPWGKTFKKTLYAHWNNEYASRGKFIFGTFFWHYIDFHGSTAVLYSYAQVQLWHWSESAADNDDDIMTMHNYLTPPQVKKKQLQTAHLH